MPHQPRPPGPLRTADDVNRDIRSLWPEPETALSGEAEIRYVALLVEWAAAVQGDVVPAA
ncbi:hypothetical protein OG923_20695 [Streptomyces halstedii]|uniref:hypothetical protein n=1 Tax=Streptomyces halstedii TaxID=1944 RepID=UPI00324F889C